MIETTQSENIITTPLTEEEKVRVKKDLQFIGLAAEIGKELGYRIFVHGGYAVDGNLGKITRPHKDLDIQIYGQEANASKAVSAMLDAAHTKDSEFQTGEIEDKGRQDYYHNLLVKRPDSSWIDLYYLQVTTDPFGKEKIIVKKDGTLSDKQSFGKPNIVTLEGVTFEAASPTEELVEKIYKREHRGDTKEAKHNQDIQNLRLITNPDEIEKKLSAKLNRQ